MELYSVQVYTLLWFLSTPTKFKIVDVLKSTSTKVLFPMSGVDIIKTPFKIQTIHLSCTTDRWFPQLEWFHLKWYLQVRLC